MSKKYYWLKLHKDFFKRHDIRIVESMPNGKDYILFYLKLMAESIDHEGRLRFNDSIPYSLDMLSALTNTNVDTVRCAIKIFTEMSMMEFQDDGTFFMNQVNKMMGSETEWARKKRAYRSRAPEIEDNVPDCPRKNEDMSDKRKSIELELEKEIELEKETIDIGFLIKFWNSKPNLPFCKRTVANMPNIRELVVELAVHIPKEVYLAVENLSMVIDDIPVKYRPKTLMSFIPKIDAWIDTETVKASYKKKAKETKDGTVDYSEGWNERE